MYGGPCELTYREMFPYYTVRLTSGIRDAQGATLAPVTWSFTTGPRPRVVGRTPGAGATGVGRAVNVTARISEAVTGIPTGPVAVTATSPVTLRSGTATGTLVPAALTYNAGIRTVTINPNANLAANALHRQPHFGEQGPGRQPVAGDDLELHDRAVT